MTMTELYKAFIVMHVI